MEPDAFDMSRVSEALGTVMLTASETDLRELLRAVDFDVLKLANVALRINNSPESVAFLLGTALMMSNEKAAEAGATAGRAEGTAGAARQEAITAQTNYDELRQALNQQAQTLHQHTQTLHQHTQTLHQQTQALVTLTSHVAELQHRVKELEKQVDTKESLVDGMSSLLIMHLEGTLTNQEVIKPLW